MLCIDAEEYNIKVHRTNNLSKTWMIGKQRLISTETRHHFSDACEHFHYSVKVFLKRLGNLFATLLDDRSSHTTTVNDHGGKETYV